MAETDELQVPPCPIELLDLPHMLLREILHRLPFRSKMIALEVCTEFRRLLLIDPDSGSWGPVALEAVRPSEGSTAWPEPGYNSGPGAAAAGPGSGSESDPTQRPGPGATIGFPGPSDGPLVRCYPGAFLYYLRTLIRVPGGARRFSEVTLAPFPDTFETAGFFSERESVSCTANLAAGLAELESNGFTGTIHVPWALVDSATEERLLSALLSAPSARSITLTTLVLGRTLTLPSDQSSPLRMLGRRVNNLQTLGLVLYAHQAAPGSALSLASLLSDMGPSCRSLQIEAHSDALSPSQLGSLTALTALHLQQSIDSAESASALGSLAGLERLVIVGPVLVSTWGFLNEALSCLARLTHLEVLIGDFTNDAELEAGLTASPLSQLGPLRLPMSDTTDSIDDFVASVAENHLPARLFRPRPLHIHLAFHLPSIRESLVIDIFGSMRRVTLLDISIGKSPRRTWTSLAVHLGPSLASLTRLRELTVTARGHAARRTTVTFDEEFDHLVGARERNGPSNDPNGGAGEVGEGVELVLVSCKRVGV